MAFPWKAAGIGAAGLLLLMAFGGDSKAATPPDNPPDPKPPGPQPPDVGPHPPNTWGNLPRGLVNVKGFAGIVTHTAPSVNAPHLAGDGGTFNGKEVANVTTGDEITQEMFDDGWQLGQNEIIDPNGRYWMRIYTPTGYEGWASSRDPQGNRNILKKEPGTVLSPGDPNPGGRPNFVAGRRREANMGQHGWYPYDEPAPVRRGRAWR